MTKITNVNIARALEDAAEEENSVTCLLMRVAASRLRELPEISDAMGWVRWKGGDRPVSLPVEVEFRSGLVFRETDLAPLEPSAWFHSGGHGDIVRFRLKASGK